MVILYEFKKKSKSLLVNFFRKISILFKIIEKSQLQQKIRKMIYYSHNIRKISILDKFSKIFQKSRF